MAEIKPGTLWFKLTFYLLLGESKGYGLIKYVSSDAAAQARHLLDGRTVTCPNNPHAPVYSLDCDWLNSAHITFRSLHSKALLVNSLPPNYRDMGDFRRIFSVVKTPPYCQVRTLTRSLNSQTLFWWTVHHECWIFLFWPSATLVFLLLSFWRDCVLGHLTL